MGIMPAASGTLYISPHDRVVVGGVAYRSIGRNDHGYVMVRTDGEGVTETFDHGYLSRLNAQGRLCVGRDYYLPVAARARLQNPDTSLSALPPTTRNDLNWRIACVESFLAFEQEGLVKRTDAMIIAMQDKIHAEALRIYRLGEPEKRRNTSRERASRDPVSPRALRGWLRDYESGGMAALVRMGQASGNRTSSLDPVVRSIVNREVQRYLSLDRPTKTMVAIRVEEAIHRENQARKLSGDRLLQAPSRETVRKEINKISPFDQYLGRYGLDAARKKFLPVGGGVQTTRLLERVEIDEHEIHLMTELTVSGLADFLSDEERLAIESAGNKGRWTISAAICTTSKCILALRLSPTGNTLVAALETLDMIVSDKGSFADHVGRLNDWYQCGPPEGIYVDSASCYRSLTFRVACADLGIEVLIGPAGMPQLRGTMERFFTTIGHRLLPRLTGRTFSTIVERGDYDSGARGSLKAEEIAGILVRWIVEEYHNTPHQGLGGQTPKRVWDTLAETTGTRPSPDLTLRRQVFGIPLERMLSRSGIQILGVHYNSEKLAAHLRGRHDRKVQVRWYPKDIGAIRVELDGNWETIPAVHRMFDGRDAVSWRETVQRLRASGKADVAVTRDLVFDAMAETDRIAAAARQRTKLFVEGWTPDTLSRVEHRLFGVFKIEEQPTRLKREGDGLGSVLVVPTQEGETVGAGKDAAPNPPTNLGTADGLGDQPPEAGRWTLEE